MIHACAPCTACRSSRLPCCLPCKLSTLARARYTRARDNSELPARHIIPRRPTARRDATSKRARSSARVYGRAVHLKRAADGLEVTILQKARCAEQFRFFFNPGRIASRIARRLPNGIVRARARARARATRKNLYIPN